MLTAVEYFQCCFPAVTAFLARNSLSRISLYTTTFPAVGYNYYMKVDSSWGTIPNIRNNIAFNGKSYKGLQVLRCACKPILKPPSLNL